MGTYNYILFKYLFNILEPHIPVANNAGDMVSFVQEIYPWKL